MSSIEKAIERLSKAKDKQNESAQSAHDGVNIKNQQDAHDLSNSDRNLEEIAESLVHEEELSLKHRISEKKYEQVKTEKNDCKLNFEDLNKAGYLTPDSNNKILSEEYRAIKRPVLMNAFGKGAVPIDQGNLIAITSSLPGEGKTYTSLNLALSIATELDSTVLIVDGDILKQQLSLLLGLEDKKGLTDVLHDPHTGIRDVLISTQIPKLKIIPAGNNYDYSTELFSSDAMQQLVAELSNRYEDRIILFDSPPLLATSEATVLNHLMGQILLVVESGKTPIEAVRESLSHIADEKVIGLVLNKTNGSAGKGGYGSYASYGGYG